MTTVILKSSLNLFSSNDAVSESMDFIHLNEKL